MAAANRADDERHLVEIGGHRVRLTNLDKVIYPESGTTKGDVIAYYTAVAPVMIPLLVDRPATRKRWVHGTSEPAFFHKDLDQGAPDWVRRQSVQHKDHSVTYPIVDNAATLVWFAQLAALEIHVPQWRFDPDGNRSNPDRMVFDLDPGEGVGLAQCAEVAGWIREILTGMNLDCFPVTSGSKGIHLYAGLDGQADSPTVSATAHELARAIEADHPDLVVSEMKKTKRVGKVFIDWSQNNAAKTTVSPYSLRGRAHPMVAAPRTWQELADPNLHHLEASEVMVRVRDGIDPLAELRPGGTDRLATYRAKRNPGHTPEPLPNAPPASGAEQSIGRYVIHSHHARRAHFDLRLERDGVLSSWALPKGLPADHQHNRLAVRTEDHPLEYLEFEGVIPSGQYGAGRMTIWDTGTFELQKWWPREVIVTLKSARGRPPARYALIGTGQDENADQWLLHLMQPREGARAARLPSSSSADAEKPAEVAAPRRAAPGSAPTRSRSATANALGLPAMEPMLASTATSTSGLDDAWALEMKWDGIRAIAGVNNGGFRLTTRSGRTVSESYPELESLVDQTRPGSVLDGEIVALDAQGRPSFELLQQRMNLADRRQIARLAGEVPVRYLAFDALVADGKPVIDRPYDERRAVLVNLLRPAGAVDLPPAFHGDLAAAIASSLELGLEGVMAKRRGSRYLPGRRSRDWLKIKHRRTVDVLVIGWRAGESGSLASVLVAALDDGELRYAGRVGSGFGERERASLLSQLRAHEQPGPLVEVPAEVAQDAHWVYDERVAEVEFSEWTSQQVLRHPVWRGWRTDKTHIEAER